MTTDADRAAFEVTYPSAHEWWNGRTYWGDYAQRWDAWELALSHERARRAEAYAGLVAEAENVAAREIVAGFEDAYQVGLIRRLVEAMKS